MRRIRPGIRIGVDVLLEHPGREIAAQFARPLLALLERDQLFLVFGIEHQVEGRGRLSEKMLAEFVAPGFGIGRGRRHGGDSKGTDDEVPMVTGILFPT